jgi:hypothetical protein
MQINGDPIQDNRHSSQGHVHSSHTACMMASCQQCSKQESSPAVEPFLPFVFKYVHVLLHMFCE